MSKAEKMTAPASGAVNAPVKPNQTAVAVPDYIKQGSNRGSENVKATDIIIPRLDLVQALSPCLKKSDPEYIEGAEPGMLFNSLTRKLYGHAALICPVYYRTEYLVWRDRKKGGGFRGAFQSNAEAQQRIKEEEEAPEEFEAIETGQQIVLVICEDGTIDEAVISMSRTKLKVSRQLNSLVRIAGGDRFSRTYTAMGVEEQNANGDDYYNYSFGISGFPAREVYEQAEKMYDSIASGNRKVVLDTDHEEQMKMADKVVPY